MSAAPEVGAACPSQSGEISNVNEGRRRGEGGGARRAEDRVPMRLAAGGKVYDCTYLSAAASGKYQLGKVESGAETQIP